MYFRDNQFVLLFVLLIIIVLAALIGSCAVVASMANKRGRSEIGWIVFSFFALPLAIILLLCLGETDIKRKERLEEEAKIFWEVWQKQSRIKQEEDEPEKKVSVSEFQEQHPGSTLNDKYRMQKQQDD